MRSTVTFPVREFISKKCFVAKIRPKKPLNENRWLQFTPFLKGLRSEQMHIRLSLQSSNSQKLHKSCLQHYCAAITTKL